ncbi:hypothetical protein DS831_01365 [Bombilactobacillus bombi]|uniref:S-layer protein C-terminal domain-containing protein n=1 Tax=Bombilactobacillus bombi TaxID=1303590 RepID=A0A417ZJ72_9LACO|nr:SLAP domain-containing protein [Bombilactobacillus bombi]RHW52007.1 hypothetical protein DS831_01365 [Bombilactobacillus bombi]
MKKSSLMGASVVAAALLAAAPIAAPVANIATGTQTVQAAGIMDNSYNETAQKVSSMSTTTTLYGEKNNKAISGTYGNFANFYNNVPHIAELGSLRNGVSKFASSEKDSANPLYIDAKDHAIKIGDGVTNGTYPAKTLLQYFFSGKNQIDLGSDANVIAAQTMGYKMSFDFSNAIGTYGYPVASLDDAYRAREDMALNGGTITMSLQLTDSRGNNIDNGLMKTVVAHNVNNQRAAYVNYDSSLQAHVGDSALIYGLANSFMNANGSIKNYNGDDITMAAYNAGAIEVTSLRDENGHGADAAGFEANGNFAKTGTYYQQVKVDLAKAGLKISDWKSAAENGLITVNGQTPSTTNADANVYLVTKDGTKVDGIGVVNAGTLVMKRTVNVSKANLSAKEDKVDGIVTVNTPSSVMAQLYTKDGSPISDRALPSGSNWKTDLKRTVYANGEVYYRVSTNEYVKASQVSFSEKAGSTSTSSATESGNVVVTPASGVFTMDTLGSLLWTKANDNQSMSVIADRYLPANSKWRVDQKAVVNGKTFYRVSTNEWVNATHGSLN